MKAMVMAAGIGTRLRPLTCTMPKPMVPIVNKPVMEHVINLLKKHNITEIIINLHHYPDSIKEYFGDGSKFGVKLTYSHEEKLMGTAGGVKKVEYFFDDTFIVLSGDGLSDINLTEAIKFHKSKKALATLILKEVDYPLEYGVVILDKDGRIKRFLEKPNWSEVFSNTANTGVYIFEPEIFREIPYGEEYDFGSTLFPKLLKDSKPLYGFVTSDYWCDIGDLPEYRQTHYDILKKKAKVLIPGIENAPDIYVGKGSLISPKANISGQVVIGENCKIEEDVEISEYTTIGNNVTVCKGTSIKRCVILDNTYISENNELRGCVIGKNCFLEENGTIFEGAVIGDDSTIGQKTVIKPNVKVWPNKIVETGVTLSTSLIWGEVWRKNLFGSYGVSGKANVEITPEFAAKLGTAYGTCIPNGSSIIISAYNDKMCKMLKRIIESSLISTGVNIHDADNLPLFMTQYAIRKLGVSGGIYINKSIYDSNSISIAFFDSQGLRVDRNMEKKIEKVFYREEFIRASIIEFGKIIPCEDFEEKYHRELIGFVNKNKLVSCNIKIVINYVDNILFSSKIKLEKLLEEIGCKVVLINESKEIKNTIIKEKAQFGIKINVQAEEICLIDENGDEINNNKNLILMIWLILKNSSTGNIAVPVNMSKKIEKLTENFNRKTFWCKRDDASLMKAGVENEIIFSGMGDGRYIFTRFQPVFDPIVSIVKLTEFLILEKTNLSDICKSIPEYYIETDVINCPWEYKGKILQDVIEEYRDNNLELIDGVKVYLSYEEWILILQDTENPFLHLWVEGNSEVLAKKLLETYKNKIIKLIPKETD